MMSNEINQETEATFDTENLKSLARELKDIFDIKDRKYGLPPKLYTNSFIGSEAVKAMVEKGIAADDGDAVNIGNILLEAGILHHVLDEHPFEDKHLYYRFRNDEEHGISAKKPDGSHVSWADFIPSLNIMQPQPINLQPGIPERDSELASFDQVDLDSCGISPMDEHNANLLDNVHPKAWIDPPPEKTYNLVVIGAGTGGLVSAAGAAGLGARVALIESHMLGGDCLNVGCVPSKALLRSAKAVNAVRKASSFGVKVKGDITVDFDFIMERMRRLRTYISPNDSAERYAGNMGVDLFFGNGKFVGNNQVEINGKTLKFSKAVIATGGTAAIPDIPGLESCPYFTNASLFNLTRLPKRLGVIGAGPIGIEMAQAFQRFGSQVTIMCRGTRILEKEDRDAGDVIRRALVHDGVEIIVNSRFHRVEPGTGKGTVRVILEESGNEGIHEFDALLIATGRKPTVSGLGLENAKVEFDERLGIQVNDRLQTTNPDIYAVGDVASKYQFTHMADFMARIVIRNSLFFGRDNVSNLIVPWVTYTDPEVGHVGLYEKDMNEQGIPFSVYRREFSDVDRSILDGETEGFVKIYVKKGSDRILGATIVGSHAGDLISELTLAIQGNIGLSKLSSVIHPYPTVAEAIRQCGDAYNRSRLTPTVKGIFSRLMAMKR